MPKESPVIIHTHATSPFLSNDLIPNNNPQYKPAESLHFCQEQNYKFLTYKGSFHTSTLFITKQSIGFHLTKRLFSPDKASDFT